jgi:hypothetical protein
MKKALVFVALALALAIAGEANASESNRDGAPETAWLAKDAIKSKLTGLGYSVRKIEAEDGRYEVKASDKEGKKVELKVNPVTGEIEKTSSKQSDERKARS